MLQKLRVLHVSQTFALEMIQNPLAIATILSDQHEPKVRQPVQLCISLPPPARKYVSSPPRTEFFVRVFLSAEILQSTNCLLFAANDDTGDVKFVHPSSCRSPTI